MDEYLDLIREFEKNPNLCNWFRLQAYDTWRRIEFARNQWGLRIFETTITQNILYQFALYKRLRNLPIKMYEAVDERSNGNDIEFEYHFKNGVLNLPMQAKILYGNGLYPRMEHGSQIDTLIDYAKDEGGYPLYILYNYWTAVNPHEFKKKTDCGIDYDIHQYGISLVSAYHLASNFHNQKTNRESNPSWIIPSFNDLHPSSAIPWFMLACCDNLSSSNDFINLFEQSDQPDKSMKEKGVLIHQSKQVDIKKWKPLELEEFIGEKREEREKYEQLRLYEIESPSTLDDNVDNVKESYQVYNPKYRIVLNKK